MNKGVSMYDCKIPKMVSFPNSTLVLDGTNQNDKTSDYFWFFSNQAAT